MTKLNVVADFLDSYSKSCDFRGVNSRIFECKPPPKVVCKMWYVLSGDYGITTGRLQDYFLFIGGCTTYQKTLVGKERGISTPIKSQKQMRSRKQSKFISALTLKCVLPL